MLHRRNLRSNSSHHINSSQRHTLLLRRPKRLKWLSRLLVPRPSSLRIKLNRNNKIRLHNMQPNYKTWLGSLAPLACQPLLVSRLTARRVGMHIK